MIWGDLFDEPVFVFTGDQDWAPVWASRTYFELVRKLGVPAHLFCTQPCPEVVRARAEGVTTIGWHPNFLPGSSHGDSIEEVISYMQRHFPSATTSRTHVFLESTFISAGLAAAGIRADSQVATLYQPGLEPLLHWTGVLRLPVFFEDDIFFGDEAPELCLDDVVKSLFSPGLKVFNFHPTFVACNIPSRQYYEKHKSRIFEGGEPVVYSGRGTQSFLTEIVEAVTSHGHHFEPFAALIARLTNHVSRNQADFPEAFLRKFLKN